MQPHDIRARAILKLDAAGLRDLFKTPISHIYADTASVSNVCKTIYTVYGLQYWVLFI
jgi:hypothetical protein